MSWKPLSIVRSSGCSGTSRHVAETLRIRHGSRLSLIAETAGRIANVPSIAGPLPRLHGLLLSLTSPLWAACTGGQGTVPYEQNTQQSPAFGFRTLAQFGQSKKYWQASVGIVSSASCPQFGQVITEFSSIKTPSLLSAERESLGRRSRSARREHPARPPGSRAPARSEPAVRPSPAASPTRGSSAAARRHAKRMNRRDCRDRQVLLRRRPMQRPASSCVSVKRRHDEPDIRCS